MNTLHEPDPRFLERLEWQLTSAGRRREVFGGPKDDFTKRRTIKMIAIVLCSVMTGVVATATTTHFQDVAKGQLYLAQAEVQLQLANSRLDYARQEAAALKERIALGLISAAEEWRAQGEVARLEIEKARLDLDREEIRTSHKAPQNALSAPLVGGRDFVIARLQLEVQSLQTVAAEAQPEAERARKLAEAGLIAPETLGSYRKELERIRRAVEEVEQKIELRSGFLRGEIPAEKVDLMALLAEAEKRVEMARLAAEQLREERDTAEKRFQIGVVSGPEMERMRIALASAEASLKLARLEVQILQENLKK